MKERKTLEEWQKEYDVLILEPNGFDMKDPHLYERKFSRKEFEHGLLQSLAMSTVEED